MKPTIVLLAAGMSTRYGRLKQLEPVGPAGEALLDYSVFDARRAGFTRVILIIREELEEDFRTHIESRWPEELEVIFHHQRLEDLPGFPPAMEPLPGLPQLLATRRKPWGTGHALLSARDLLPDPFVLLNADDFYGPWAFRQGASLLSGGIGGGGEAPAEFGLVVFTLKDTLTPHGGVSRGVSAVDEEGWLVAIQETLNIRKEGAEVRGSSLSGDELVLSGRESTSTNFWIFTPEIFPHLEKGFQEFLIPLASGDDRPGVGASGDSPKKEPEFLVPVELNRLLVEGRARVKVFRTRDPFFGITHPQDWEWVAGGLRRLADAGEYPNPLWAPASPSGPSG